MRPRLLLLALGAFFFLTHEMVAHDVVAQEPAPAPNQNVPAAADAADPLQEILDAALADFHEAEAEALDELSRAISIQFDAATKKGDLELANKCQEAKTKLESNGVFPTAPVFANARSKAERSLRRAEQKLGSTFDSVIKAYTRNKDLKRATAVQAEKEKIIQAQVTDKRGKIARPLGGWPRNTAADTFTNSVGMVFIRLPEGTFLMGSPNSEVGRFNRVEDQVEVTISQPFFMAQTEVTQPQWEAVMGPTKWQNQRIGPNYPAVQMTWQEASEYCEKLTRAEQRLRRLPVGWQYSLPTEAQWEYGCRAGSKASYCCGNDVECLDAFAWWGCTDGGSTRTEPYTHEVGRKKPNAWGLYDMHGNVWEWCKDWWHVDLASGVDPTGPAEGDSHVVRGGYWGDPRSLVRSAVRAKVEVEGKSAIHGFRVVCVCH